MATTNYGERLVALETKMDTVISQQSEMNGKLDAALPTFVTQTEFTQYKSSQNVQKVLLSVLMVIVGSLAGFFVSNVVGK